MPFCSRFNLFRHLFKRTQFVLLLLGAVCLFAPAHAHGPSPQRLEEKVIIAASPEKVWSLIENFSALADWHPLVSSSDVSSSESVGSNSTGATREVVLADGHVVERLDRHKPAQKRYGYRLLKENAEAIPASFYSAKLSVNAVDEGAEVVWKGMFYRADTSNYPAEGRTDEAGREALSHFFRVGLDNLKKLAEE